MLSGVACLTGTSASPARADFGVDLEGGGVFQGYNDVRIPGDVGTDLSLTDDLSANANFYARVRLGWFVGRHALSLLAAPVRVDSDGTVPFAVRFDEATFPAGVALDARYQFDTYRLSYRYLVVDRPTVRFGVGVTGLLRVASIRIESANTSATKDNVGFVPLLRLEAEWQPLTRAGLSFDVDGLVAPQGRAFDAALAVFFAVTDTFRLRVGYRMIEGGSDSDEVYNFSWLHFAFVGAAFRF